MAFTVLLYAQAAPAETFYMPDACSSLQNCFALMSGGDELIIRDGTYTGTSNVIDDQHRPPSGISIATMTIVRAENPGAVIFDGQHTRSLFYVNANNSGNLNYIKFQGIVWRNTATEGAVSIFGRADSYNEYIWFSQCGVADAGVNQPTSSNGLYMRYVNHALIEDCYAWGELYYGLSLLQCSNSIIRRGVVRYDVHRGDRGGGVSTYSSSNIEIQNCIVIDSDQQNAYSGITEMLYAYAFPTTNGPSTGVHVRGAFALNFNAPNLVAGLISQNGGGSGFTFDDFIVYDVSGGFWGRITDTVYSNSVFANTGGERIGEGLVDFEGGGAVYDSLVFGNTSRGTNVPTSQYNFYYSNGTDGSSDVSNSYGVNPGTNGYLYLPRIEAESILATAGQSSGRVGPEAIYQIGGTGTFYGDPGYNTASETELWPFPNENTIKAFFAAYQGNSNATVSGDRGFASTTAKQLDGTSDVTLTSYIWEYLGNKMPPEIYGDSENGACGSTHGSSSVDAPASNLCTSGTASSVTDSGASWTWTCAGTNGGSTANCSATEIDPEENKSTNILLFLPSLLGGRQQ